jgi:hypothetical protein
MTNLKYYRLIAYFYSTIFDIVKQNVEIDIALSRTLDGYWFYPEDENRLSNLIVVIHFMNVEYAMNKVFTKAQIKLYKDQLELIKDDDLTIWLNEEELTDLNETISQLNTEIDDFLNKN